jgi:hypothetical protein
MYSPYEVVFRDLGVNITKFLYGLWRWEAERRQTMDERTELKKQRMNYEKLSESSLSFVCR